MELIKKGPGNSLGSLGQEEEGFDYNGNSRELERDMGPHGHHLYPLGKRYMAQLLPLKCEAFSADK